MSYIHLDTTTPDATTQSIVALADSARLNLIALRDAVASGYMPGWDMTPSGGTSEQPAVITLSNGAERVRQALTWGVTGGEDGNVTSVALDYSNDSGAAWHPMGTQSITYDSAGNVTGTIWS